MTQVSFILFNLIFFLIGRSLNIFFHTSQINKNIDEKKIFGINIYVFYPLIALIFVSNLVFLLNFLFPIEPLIPYIFLFGGVLIIYNISNKPKINVFKFKFLTFFVFPLLLSISSHGIWLGWDTGLYHLQNQAWIRESNLVLGLSNLNVWLGWSSIYEYLSSLFWLNGNYVVIHFVKLVVYNFFFCFLLHNIFENENKYLKFSSLGILLFSLLDNIGYLGGGNGFPPILTVGKFDEAFGILFFVNSALILMRIMDKNFVKSELIFIFYFSLYSFQLKQNGAYIIFPLLLYFYMFIKKSNAGFFKSLNLIKLPIVIGSLWILKNVLITSCLLYPVTFTCISNLDWYGINTNYATEGWLIRPAIDPRLDESISQQFASWLSQSKNKQYSYNFLISLVSIYIVNKIVLLKVSSERNNKAGSNLILFFIVLIIFWFYSNGANPRYAFGIWLFGITLLYKNYENYEIRPIFTNYLRIIVITTSIVSVALVPRIYSYEAFIENQINFSEITLPWENKNPSFAGLSNPEYKESKYGFGVYSESALCWEVTECHHIDKSINYNSETFFKKFTTQSTP